MQRLKNRTFCIRDLEENHFSRSFFAHHSANVQVANYLDDRKSIIICTTIELYTIQRYLQYDTLQEMGLIHFDDWASDFGETITAIELSPEGYNLVGR